MRLFSTRRESPEVGFEEAIFRGLPPDNGLYMPKELPVLPASFWDQADQLSFQEIAFEISRALLSEEIPAEVLRQIVDTAVNFPAPLVKVSDDTYCLELFHGSSMAFKDFGARFMAATMSYFLQKSDRKINILVATSGDTGGAVAQGFFGVPNITVTILYPKGKVSEIQEKQLTTLGGNVRAIEIEGTFDDCQALVKKAFLDEELRNEFTLASANSINIARLIPQSFYYAQAYASLKKEGLPVVFSVPSGNFGNLSAGIIAWKMGMPVHQFIAATNANNVVPEYLRTKEYYPINPSISTISNAMDVGDPSNFPRMIELFSGDFELMKSRLSSYYYSDEQTKEGIKALYNDYHYAACPHTAIAWLGLQDFRRDQAGPFSGVFLSTAHYAKFLPEMEAVLQTELEIPDRLKDLLDKTKVAAALSTDYALFKAYLRDTLEK